MHQKRNIHERETETVKECAAHDYAIKLRYEKKKRVNK